MIERFHWTRKTVLKARLTGPNWAQNHTQRRLRLFLSRASLRLNIPLYAPRPALHHSSAVLYLSPSLSPAKHVYVQRDGTKGPLERPYSGPYVVLNPGDKTFLTNIGGRAECISEDRIKPAFFDPIQPVILAKPPPRGRPPSKQSHPSRNHPSNSSTASKHQQAMSGPASRRRRVQVLQFDRLYETTDCQFRQDGFNRDGYRAFPAGIVRTRRCATRRNHSGSLKNSRKCAVSGWIWRK